MGRRSKDKGRRKGHRFCEECGARLEGAKFCEECGAPVEVKKKREAPREEEEVPELAPLEDDEEVVELTPMEDEEDVPELAPLEENTMECELCRSDVKLDKMYTCQDCGINFCMDCEGKIEKVDVYRKKPLRFNFPLCEKCYETSYLKQKKRIDEKIKTPIEMRGKPRGKGKRKRDEERFTQRRRPKRDIWDDGPQPDENIDEFFDDEGVKVFNPIGAHEVDDEVYHEVPETRRDRGSKELDGVRGKVIRGPDQVVRGKKQSGERGRDRPRKGRTLTCPCGETIKIRGQRMPDVVKCPHCGRKARLRR